MSALNSCKSSPERSYSKDLCQGAQLIYFEADKSYSDKDQDYILSNNVFACNNCFDYLTKEEQITCINDE
jgi:hypothetical protein